MKRKDEMSRAGLLRLVWRADRVWSRRESARPWQGSVIGAAIAWRCASLDSVANAIGSAITEIETFGIPPEFTGPFAVFLIAVLGWIVGGAVDLAIRSVMGWPTRVRPLHPSHDGVELVLYALLFLAFVFSVSNVGVVLPGLALAVEALVWVLGVTALFAIPMLAKKDRRG